VDQRKQYREPRPDGEQRKPRGREFDKHSAGKTGNKFEPKRQGGGAANWGSPIEQPDPNASGGGWGADPDTPVGEKAGGWGDEGAQATEPVVAASGGWGDENEPKPAAPADEPEKEYVPPPFEEKKKEREPDWDEVEGHGKMTFAEFEKVKAQKDAELLAKIGGSKELRKVDAPTDLGKFRDWRDDLADDKDKKLAAKKEQKKGQPKSGIKNVELTELFDVKGPGGRGGRGGRGRGGFQGDRPPRVEGQQQGEEKPRRGGYQGNRGQGGYNRVPSGAKQFPDLVPQNSAPKQTK